MNPWPTYVHSFSPSTCSKRALSDWKQPRWTLSTTKIRGTGNIDMVQQSPRSGTRRISAHPVFPLKRVWNALQISCILTIPSIYSILKLRTWVAGFNFAIWLILTFKWFAPCLLTRHILFAMESIIPQTKHMEQLKLTTNTAFPYVCPLASLVTN